MSLKKLIIRSKNGGPITPRNTEILLNDILIDGITKISFELDANNMNDIARVTLTFIPELIDVQGELELKINGV